MHRLSIQSHFNLQAYNSFGLTAYAERFAAITVEEQLEITQKEAQTPLILGGGSNILFSKDVAGLVLHNAMQGIKILSEDSESVWVRSAGGVIWHELVLWCIQQGYAGIENLSLIPGTVGAAPIQNIGAYGVELKDVFYELEAIELSSGLKRTFNKEEAQFAYRDSIFKKDWKGKLFISSVTLQLNKKPIFNTSYGDIISTLGNKTVNLKNLSDAVIQIRRSKLPDPKEIGNAGSFFKNPIIPKSQYQQLLERYPNLPSYPIDGLPDLVKVPAGWLIDQAGWKGKRFGAVGVHAKQALVLVNYGAGTGAQIWQLAQDIQADVLDKYGIEISAEVNVV